MKKAAMKISHRSVLVGTLLTSLLAGAGCVADEQLDTSDDALTASATAQPPVTPQMEWLAKLPAVENGELALGKFFARGTANYLPVGSSTGFPVLFNSVTDLNWLASGLWGGKTLRVVSPDTQPNGDPIVRLDNKIIKTPTGGLLNLFQAYVTRSTVSELVLGKNSKGEVVPLPHGSLAPLSISFLSEPVTVDGKPSVWLNYFEDTTLPVIRRILDEIREVDGVACKGLYIGRAHARRCTSLSCGELPSLLLDLPTQPTFATRYQWGFWTYFLLNFGQPAGSKCDITAAVATAQAQLAAEGVVAQLPPVPAAE
jgi:hypothetical protein